ncbi:signal peptidase I [Dawidia soli]|uniref:Signal peptidase I n=1 Tax=Dawidia soli TaxID=2782352 RepID=A0AAP2DEU1_9BACT|nr:signal peptidase I [Dawidia soli]MBT1689831.1 signal peptidase I [Dawidia soli]
MNRYTIKWRRWLFWGFLVVVLSVGIKLFVVDLRHVPTASMEQCILVGDYILVNKLSYGARMPRSPLEIPWFNLFALDKHVFPWFRDTHWGYNRLSHASVSRDDIMVFEGPWDDETVLVKRCRALPGDIVEVSADQLFINGAPAQDPETIRYQYGYYYPGCDTAADQAYPYSLHPDTARLLRRRGGERHLRLSPYLQNESNDVKAMQVPSRDLSINLHRYKRALPYYINIINRYEGASVEVVNDTILINGVADSVFTFKYDYYFLLGDNRRYSEDSRKWGFVPEQNVIGKAARVLFSKDRQTNHIRWNRFFCPLK